MALEIFDDPVWQMSLGERAAIEGVLAQVQPKLAIEIGSMEGACLRRIAAHAEEVHSFDLHPPSLPVSANVTLHTGDSHRLLPVFLEQLAAEGQNVDFVIVDGDHTPEGVRRDLEDLLNSSALGSSVILIHDTANQRVRSGIDAVHFAAWPKVSHVELDWVPGHMFKAPEVRNELWYGLGLVIIDDHRLAYGRSVFQDRYYPAAQLLHQARRLLQAHEQFPALADELDGLRERVGELSVATRKAQVREARLLTELRELHERHRRAEKAIRDITGSVSWRLTGPLRGAKRRAQRSGQD